MHIWHNDADSNWSTYEMFKIGIIIIWNWILKLELLLELDTAIFVFLMRSQYFDPPWQVNKTKDQGQNWQELFTQMSLICSDKFPWQKCCIKREKARF